MKNKITKKIIALSMSLIFVLCFTISPFAANVPSNDEIMPLWDSIHSMEIRASFADGKYNVVGIAYKQSTATSIEGTLTIYQQVDDNEWEHLGEWSQNTTSSIVAISGSVDAISGVHYKAVFEVTAYTGSSPECDYMERIDICS